MPPKPTKPSTKPPPGPPQPILTKQQEKAINEANKIKDTESEQYKLQIRKQLRQLKRTVEEQEKLMAYFQQQRQKINYNWIIAKKEVDDSKSQLINKQREIEDLKEGHIMTLNIYKQKLKHLMFQQHDERCQLQKDVEITLKQLQQQHRLRDRQLKTDVRALHVSLKQQQLSSQDYKFALKVEHDKKKTDLRQQFDRKATDLKKKYDLKMAKLRQQMQTYRKKVIADLEARKDQKIKQLTKQHSQKYSDIKTYYTQITATNLDLIKQYRNQINELQLAARIDKKTLLKIQQQRKNLLQPLKALEIEIKKLQQDIKKQDQIRKQKADLKVQIDKVSKLYEDLEYQYEVKLQSSKYKEKEKQTLFNVFNNAVYSIHQKAGLNNLILEKKLNTVDEQIEIKDLQLGEVLKAANIDPRVLGAITTSFEEVEASKNDLIVQLQNQLQQIRKTHSYMVKAYEGKLSQFVIPVEELGFDPLVPSSSD